MRSTKYSFMRKCTMALKLVNEYKIFVRVFFSLLISFSYALFLFASYAEVRAK